ncbi:SDR family oxidoreductase [Singulisphaera acidiphila]|uniref:dTDP-4-dehydrorhamnose reductase n=2 Tax=Singulisphaera acidiphila TaxID=466153 RepID=L0DH82_SINAD|nr:SDR family oxidoreductase [Singulisphaera acidiphila]AGA28617.1 dTDP-4-dehydrorhamnose reductase [Singulisphaera acidiphila DSM 18658]
MSHRSTAAAVRMRAAVIGGSGQLGGWLLRVLAERGHDAAGTFATTAFPGLTPLDAADSAAAADWVRSQNPSVVFYPAGFTWVDGCERDPGKARAANVEQPLNLARAAAEVGARFVYFSTDYVFDGQDGPYAESAAPRPLSVYGQAKLEAEQALADALGDLLLVARTTWVYGPERQGKNFAYQLAKALSEGRSLPCPSDQVSTPSYGPDVAQAMVRLIEQGRSGLVHVAGPDLMDRVAFAQALAHSFGLNAARIEARTTAELGQGAPRPLKSGLLTPRLDAWLPGLMRPLADCLLDFRARLDEPGGWVRPLVAT